MALYKLMKLRFHYQQEDYTCEEENGYMKKKKFSLPLQITVALIAGIVVGLVCASLGLADFTANYLKPFGTIFINLLKFIVVPVVVLSMISGIVSMGDMKKVGSVGWKSLAYFLCTTAIACVIGLFVANLFNGAGLFKALPLAEGAEWTGATDANFMDTLVNIFPTNLWESFRTANMLQVIVISLLIGGGILAAGEKGELCSTFSGTEIVNAYAMRERALMFDWCLGGGEYSLVSYTEKMTPLFISQFSSSYPKTSD